MSAFCGSNGVQCVSDDQGERSAVGTSQQPQRLPGFRVSRFLANAVQQHGCHRGFLRLDKNIQVYQVHDFLLIVVNLLAFAEVHI